METEKFGVVIWDFDKWCAILRGEEIKKGDEFYYKDWTPDGFAELECVAVSYNDKLFLCDMSEGRVMALDSVWLRRKL